MKATIAIDGPAASGKSSVAKKLAPRVGFSYVNSGMFYRVMTWWALNRGVNVANADAVSVLLGKSVFTSDFADHIAFFQVDGIDAEKFIHDDSINGAVSSVARLPAVRDIVTSHLRELGRKGNVVVEGRDIGSVVFPDTPYKFYIDASPEVRQQRRAAQGQQDAIAERDRLDSSRVNAPLVIAKDATVIDSTHLSIDGVVEEIIGRLRQRGLPLPVQ